VGGTEGKTDIKMLNAGRYKKGGYKKRNYLLLKLKKQVEKCTTCFAAVFFSLLLLHSSNLPASSFGEVLLILKIGQVKNCSCVLC